MTTDGSDLKRALADWASNVADTAAQQVVVDAQADAPVGNPDTDPHSGTLQAGIHVIEAFDTPTENIRAVGTVGVYWADFTDSISVGPHDIFSNGPKLRFFWDRGPAGPGIYYRDHVYWVPRQDTARHWFADRNQERWETALETAVESVPFD